MKKFIALSVLALMALTAWAVSTRVVGNNAIVGTRTLAAAPCKLYAILGQTTNSASQYVHVYDNPTSMTNGGTPKFAFPISANSYFFLDFGDYGADMDKVGVCNSTTPWTTTLGSSNCSFQAVIGNL